MINISNHPHKFNLINKKVLIKKILKYLIDIALFYKYLRKDVRHNYAAKTQLSKLQI